MKSPGGVHVIIMILDSVFFKQSMWVHSLYMNDILVLEEVLKNMLNMLKKKKKRQFYVLRDFWKEQQLFF